MALARDVDDEDDEAPATDDGPPLPPLVVSFVSSSKAFPGPPTAAQGSTRSFALEAAGGRPCSRQRRGWQAARSFAVMTPVPRTSMDLKSALTLRPVTAT
mmetsp:Transcript_13190/g.33277  ORF Transcript_13190/g.33277 Transcript_13190/m.33277 type:complete len:100 (-) Transcript_13190:97-396(-)